MIMTRGCILLYTAMIGLQTALILIMTLQFFSMPVASESASAESKSGLIHLPVFRLSMHVSSPTLSIGGRV